MRAHLKKLERTRHIKFCMAYDLFTIANHGHLVFMVSCTYDPAVYYTNDQQKTTGAKEDIQAKVERPESLHSYKIRRQWCGVTGIHRNKFGMSTRYGSVHKHQVRNSYHTLMLIFHGDSRARQFECGQQKCRNFYCSGCGARVQKVYGFDYCLHCPYTWAATSVMKGPMGRWNYLARSNHELNTKEINEGEAKKELEAQLVEEMHGVQSVPATDLYKWIARSLCTAVNILKPLRHLTTPCPVLFAGLGVAVKQ